MTALALNSQRADLKNALLLLEHGANPEIIANVCSSSSLLCQVLLLWSSSQRLPSYSTGRNASHSFCGWLRWRWWLLWGGGDAVGPCGRSGPIVLTPNDLDPWRHLWINKLDCNTPRSSTRHMVQQDKVRLVGSRGRQPSDITDEVWNWQFSCDVMLDDGDYSRVSNPYRIWSA